MKRLLILLTLLASLIPALSSAQTNPLTLRASVGLGGVSRISSWTPVNITLANTGNDLSGEVQWQWDAGGPIFAQALDLPRGSNKQLVLPVRNTNWSREAMAQYVVGGRVVAQQRVSIDVVDQGQLLVGTIGDTETRAVADLSTTVDNGQARRLIQLTAAGLPERAELLEAFNYLVLGSDAAELSPEQRSALAGWVTAGGTLLLNGARPETARALGDLAPAEVGTTTTTVALKDVVNGIAIPRPQQVTLVALTLRPGAQARVQTASGITIAEQARGTGRVIQAAFDLGALSAAGVSAETWTQQLGLFNQQFQGVVEQTDFLQQALNAPGLRLPSLPALLGFLLLYLVLVGPVNYLVLKRFDRREWAYLTVPLTVVVFTAGAYLWGAAGRGHEYSVSQLTIVHTANGATTGQAHTEFGVYSPNRQTYTLGLPVEALVGESEATFRRTIRGGLHIVRNETGVTVENMLIDVGELQAVTADQSLTVPAVTAELDGAALVVRNRSAATLEDVVVAQNGNAQHIGTLAPGAEQRIPLPLTDFVGNLNLATDGTINRQSVVSALLERTGFGKFGPDVMPVPAPAPVLPPPTPTPGETGQPGSYPAPSVGAVAPANVEPAAPQSAVIRPPLLQVPVNPAPVLALDQLQVLAWLPASDIPFQVDGQRATVSGATLLVVGVKHAANR